jgi:hypothetical protein
MSAVGIYRASRVSWQNPSNRDLDHTEVWGGTVNNRASATLVGVPKSTPGVSQTWLHTNLTPAAVWYYWVRAIDHTGNASGYFPTSPTAGWSATVTGIPAGDLAAGGLTWTEVTAATQAMAVGTGYIANRATLITFSLPTTAPLGSMMEIVGKGAGGWRISQASGQSIYIGRRQTTVGTGGSLSSHYPHNAVVLVCIVADTTFDVVGGA